MKKLFLALLCTFSFAALAENPETIYPRVYNYGFSFQIETWNHTDDTVTCSGRVNYETNLNRNYSFWYYEVISPRQTAYKNVNLNDFRSRIRSVTHSIYCH